MNASAWRSWMAAALLPIAACSADQPARTTTPSSTATAPASSTTAGPASQPATATATDGWYFQRRGGHWFQPCGANKPIPIAASSSLLDKARAFGLEDDLPVYVRLVLAQDGGDPASAGQVVGIEQFGSDTPVLGCAMTGMVAPEPDGN